MGPKKRNIGEIIVLTILLIAGLGATVNAYTLSHPKYIGWCDQVDFGQGEAYWSHDGVILAAMEHQTDADGVTWWIARIEGGNSYALFQNRQDAVDWVMSRKYVKVKP